jgi:hypothetical protein
MDTTNPGTQVAPGQGAGASQTTQAGTEQAPLQTTAATTPQQTTATTAQSPTPEQIAQWQQEAHRATQLEANYKQLQAEFTRTRQAMATLTGNANGQPQQDPLEPYVKNLVSQGYDEKDARAIAGTQYQMVQPLMQQNQQLQAAIQGNAQVGDVLREGWSKAPQLFSDAQILQSVEQVLRAEAMRGNQINAEYAIDLAFVAEGRKRLANAQQSQQQPPQVPPNIGGQFNWASGFGGPPQTAQQQAKPLPADTQAHQAALEARYPGLKKQA